MTTTARHLPLGVMPKTKTNRKVAVLLKKNGMLGTAIGAGIGAITGGISGGMGSDAVGKKIYKWTK